MAGAHDPGHGQRADHQEKDEKNNGNNQAILPPHEALSDPLS
jgi:hypothetical protein